VTPKVIIDYWFSPRIAEHWFASTEQLDQEIRRSFEAIWKQASAGGLDHWMAEPEGCLALAIILDQFPLNMYRGRPKAFVTEGQAIAVARHAIDNDFQQKLPPEWLPFLYMPFMHSEDPEDQALSVELFTRLGRASNARFALHHQDIVRRFGRFPHRNRILKRVSTPEELRYLQSDEAFTG